MVKMKTSIAEQLKIATDSLTALNAELATVKTEHATAAQEATDLKAQLAQLQSDFDTVCEKHEGIALDNVGLTNKVNELTAQLEAAKQSAHQKAADIVASIGAGKLPSGRGLGAGRQAGLRQAQGLPPGFLDRRGTVEDARLDHARRLLEPGLPRIQVIKDFLRVDDLFGELEGDVSGGDDVLGLGIDLEPVGEQLDVFVLDLDVPGGEDPVLFEPLFVRQDRNWGLEPGGFGGRGPGLFLAGFRRAGRPGRPQRRPPTRQENSRQKRPPGAGRET